VSREEIREPEEHRHLAEQRRVHLPSDIARARMDLGSKLTALVGHLTPQLLYVVVNVLAQQK
jgi:hypothetical protein